MEVLKAAIIYLMSIVASRTLKLMTPIEFEDKNCESSYTTRIDEGKVTYIVTVNQWCMISKTRLRIFNTTSKYYVSEILILLDDKIVGTKKHFFPKPVQGFWGWTKLPHALIALAALEKFRIEANRSSKPA